MHDQGTGWVTVLGLAVWLAAAGTPPAAGAPADRLPNFVIVYADDMGYADVGVQGAKWPTPNLDRLAAQGVRFTDFYVAQAVCSASRAALLTGCYPNRVGIQGALGPSSRHGIHPDEATIAESLRPAGYRSAVFGKWHLGHLPEFLPTRHGFDEYFGLPYSNDMWPLHPTGGDRYPDLPLIDGETIVNPKVTASDQAQLTTWYTARAVRFIEQNQDRPFFLYVAHNMPHVPLHVSTRFEGRSVQGLYGDVIMEIDWSVGQILSALRQHGLDDRTMVLFTSDNGPWLSYGEHAGSALPLREGKGTSWEGGVRVPCLMRWPGRIPAGSVCKEPAMTIDVLPTLARLAGTSLPRHAIDGKDIWPLIAGEPGARSPHDALFFYWDGHLQAVRSGSWSLHFPHAYRTLAGRLGGTGGKPVGYHDAKTDRALFDLDSDIGQSRNVAAQHPEVVTRLSTLADRARRELGDSASGRKGEEVRQPGRVSAPGS